MEKGNRKNEKKTAEKENRKRRVSAAMTVEASLVMAVVLFTCAALLEQGFRVHEKAAGMLILMDAAERAQTGTNRDRSLKESQEWANKALNSYYRCAGGTISLEKKNGNLTGKFQNSRGEQQGMVEVKLFEPEQFLRIVRAIGI